MSDFSHVDPPVPAVSVQQPTSSPAPQAPSAPGQFVPSNVQTPDVQTDVNADNAHSLLATVADIVRQLVTSAHISEDDKRVYMSQLANAERVESAEDRQARERKEARVAELRKQLAEAEQA